MKERVEEREVRIKVNDLLDDILAGKEPMESWMLLEQKLNDGSPTGFTDKGKRVGVEFDPRRGSGRFWLSVFVARRDKVWLELANPTKEVSDFVGMDDEKVLFMVHPEMEERLEGVDWLEKKDLIEVRPTSSARTVYVENGDVFAKLAHRVLGRSPRHITKKRIEGGRKISVELERVIDEGELEFGILPEVIGIVGLDKNGEEIGVIYREVKPRVKDWWGQGIIFPFFSLVAKENVDKPLLFEVLDRVEKPGEWMEELLKKIVTTWLNLALDYGILLEAHGQNSLLEITPDLRKFRVIYRDLYDVWVDVERRKKHGLGVDFVKIVDREKEEELTLQQRSFLFDFKLGDYVLEPLLNTFIAWSGSRREGEMIRSRVIEMVSSLVRGEDFFPEKKYVFPDSMKVFRSDRPIYEERDELKWRKG